jgi:hypothetical protein
MEKATVSQKWESSHILLQIFFIFCVVCELAGSVLLTQYCAGGKIEKNEMDQACGAYGGGEMFAQGFGGEAWGKETTGETQT